jgi:rhamnose transport system permease protein
MAAPSKSSGWKAVLLSHEFILFVVLVAEWFLFYRLGTSTNARGMTTGFGSLNAQFDILRHMVEIGLLALVMTPVILTGGIDLSVGSVMGFSAVVFGKLWQDGHTSIAVAILGALATGLAAGGLNAFLITWLRLPPLIVTLGTYSLFRGFAEALTHGADIYTGFPDSFRFIGQERWLGVPAQLPIFIVVAVAVWLLVHRTTFGRSFRAIGYAPEGTRYAGIPVERRLALAYILSGTVSALAGVIYVARLNQATAADGTGFELAAITAVVLGGTSIFGGVGTVHGTLLGVVAVAVLGEGLSYAHQPRELGGMLTGVLLIVALSASVLPKVLSKWRSRRQTTPPTPQPTPST